MLLDPTPNFVNRGKAVSSRLQTGGVYIGIVTKTVADKIYVRVPKLGGTAEYGPCLYNGISPDINDRVLVGFLDNQLSELVCFGTLGRTAADSVTLGDAFDAIETKAPKDSPTFTGTVVLPSTTSIGSVSLSEISYLDGITGNIQDQLNLKAPLASPTFTGTVTLPSSTSIGNVSSTELGYIDGLTSSAQTQLNAKAPLASPTFTGTVTLPSTTSIGNVSSIELGYLDGVTSSIQDQLTAKAPATKSLYTTTTATYTLGFADVNRIIQCNYSTPQSVTIPTDSTYNFAIGTEVHVIRQDSNGTVTIKPSAGVTLNGLTGTPTGDKTLRAQYSMVTLIKRGTNEWYIVGDYS